MEKQLKYEKIRYTDWSKHEYLTTEQRNKLIQEKMERAKMQSIATQRLREKLGV